MRTMGDLEADVMALLWSSAKPLTVRDVLNQMNRQPPLAYTTVLTVMDNLHRKNFVRRQRVGRAFEYWPAKGRADFTADLMDDLLNQSGDRSAVLLRFVDHMSPEEIARMREVLDD